MIQRLSFWIMMIVCSVMVSGQEYDGYYTNPILPSGADPWVVKHEGWYYYCCGVPGGIGVSRSRDLHKINPPVRVWKAPEKGQWNSTCIWAPELHFWKGKWYIFYAGGYSGPPFIHQKTGVLESVTSDAMGEAAAHRRRLYRLRLRRLPRAVHQGAHHPDGLPQAGQRGLFRKADGDHPGERL